MCLCFEGTKGNEIFSDLKDNNFNLKIKSNKMWKKYENLWQIHFYKMETDRKRTSDGSRLSEASHRDYSQK